MYICVEDLQGDKFGVGKMGDEECWRTYAMEWADCDCNESLYNELEEMDKNEVIDFVADLWQIRILEATSYEAVKFIETYSDIELLIINFNVCKHYMTKNTIELDDLIESAYYINPYIYNEYESLEDFKNEIGE